MSPLAGRVSATRAMDIFGKGAVPPLSLAAGVDYGVLHRAFHPDARADMRLSFAEAMALALCRLYVVVVKLRPETEVGGVVSALKGHAVSFAHDGPIGVADSRIFSVNNLLASLRVLFVAPARLHALMRRAATFVHDLFLRPHVVIPTLRVLRQTHHMYQNGTFPSDDELAASLEQLRQQLLAEPLLADGAVELELEAMLARDVAGVRDAAEPEPAAAEGAD